MFLPNALLYNTLANVGESVLIHFREWLGPNHSVILHALQSNKALITQRRTEKGDFIFAVLYNFVYNRNWLSSWFLKCLTDKVDILKCFTTQLIIVILFTNRNIISIFVILMRDIFWFALLQKTWYNSAIKSVFWLAV